MRTTRALAQGYCLAALVAGCSSSSSPAPSEGPADASGGTTVGDGGAVADAAPDGTTASDGGGGGSVSGIVVDFSASNAVKNFDATQYPALSGVSVCVYGNTSVPCVTTDASGKYSLVGLPSGALLYLSYMKTGFAPVLYGVTPTAGTPVSAPAILEDSTAAADSWATDGGAPTDPTKGAILFGALMAGPSTSPFHEVFGGTEYFYVGGYTVTISPAATAGPVYTSANWAPDPSLTSSSAAGWGFFTAPPGDYTLTFTLASMTCGTTTTKVVAGYWTTYVGTLCSGASGAGGLDGGSD
jgi:hypothetical protein